MCEIGGNNYKDFSDSLYKTKKYLNLKGQFRSYVPCSKCHKLYKKSEVKNFKQGENPAIMKCRHIEFPNSTLHKSRLCNTPLSQKIGAQSIIIRPNLIYPFSGIKEQLATMFNQPEFENSLRHWTNRTNFDNILTDVYDGQIWKNFKETANDDNSPNFF